MTFFFEFITDMTRWLHVIAAIAWLGFALHTRELERKTKPRSDLPEGSVGEVWSIHGYGFYRTIKYLSPPRGIPESLVWYKWQVRTTWLSGFFLMAMVYYRGADLYLVRSSSESLAPMQAVGVSLGGLVASWFIYTALYRTPLAKRESLIIAAVYAFLLGSAYFYEQIFSARGVLMQMGATMATIVIANICFVTFPILDEIMHSARNGLPAPAAAIERGNQRGRHNNYMLLAIVFLMVSSHFPSAMAARPAWLLIGCVMVIGGVLRHFYDHMHEFGEKLLWPWLVTVSLVLALATWGEVAHRQHTKHASDLPPVVISTGDPSIDALVAARCLGCHSAQPRWPGLVAPPKGVTFENSEQIERYAQQIVQAVVVARTMPPGNVTGMTEPERIQLDLWLSSRQVAAKLAQH